MTGSAQRQEGLAEAERLRTAIEASGDLVYDWDLATDRIEWFGQVGRVFGEGRSAMPLSGDRFNGRVNPEDLPSRMQAAFRAFRRDRAL